MKLILAIVLLSLTGCYRSVIRTPAPQSGFRGERTGFHFVDGLTDAEFDAPCPNGIAHVTLVQPFTSVLLSFFTFGIVSSTRVEFICAGSR